MKTVSATLLLIAIVAQLAVLGTLIRSRELVLRDGEAFRFKTRPIDPADPFQGRYVSLGFDNNFVSAANGETSAARFRETVYVRIEADPDGFARFSGWSLKKPASGAFLKTRCKGERSRWDSTGRQSESPGIWIDIPFNRYYMDEAKAPRAEAVVRDAARGSNCWAVVRILNGRAVVEDVIAKGQSLRDIAARKK